MSLIDAFGLASGIFWIITYACVIRQGLVDRTYAMPFLALVMNITWEFLFTFAYPSVGGILQESINAVWFAADIAILVVFLKFWRSDYPKNLPEAFFWPKFFFAFAMVTPVMMAVVSVFGREDGSVYTAYVDNLIMSVLFLTMLIRRGDRRGQSLWIAWGKLLGTLSAAISQYLYDPANVLWLVIYIEIVVLDTLYVILLSKAPRYQRDLPAAPAPA
ncbi:transmembrane-type terpene cyclase [Mycolicibacterium sp. Dal123E01]|uniref:transmembrane-type terpene cyclase n=1 Tax=Mycolicibacterium sp. Dal123E01 TaxID=3457578 RepID=UPI00403EACA6